MLAALAFAAFNAAAEIPSPEKLLPDDTLIVFSIPDFSKMREIYASSPQTKLWSDPAMKPFVDKFEAKLKSELIDPLQRELGIRFEDYTSLPQGQLTLAITQNGNTGTNEPGVLLLMDAKDKSSQLTTNLAALRKKWLDSGKTLKTEKVRDIEFSFLPISADDLPNSLKKMFADADADADEDEADSQGDQSSMEKAEVILGQYESLLIVGSSLKPVEKVAVRLTGGAMPALGDLASFEKYRASMFREAPMYAWVNAKAMVELLQKNFEQDADEEDPFGIDFGKVIEVLGFGGLKAVAFATRSTSDGVSGELAIGVPEAERKGLFKILAVENKPADPLPFVPADVTEFQRIRIDCQKAWATVEKMISDFSPQGAGSMNMVIDTVNAAAREKDPGFDIRKSLFGNLGDDLITYKKAPAGTKLEQIASPPTLVLIGSPRPDELASAIKTILALASQGGAPTEREFLGRKIISAPLPSPASILGAGTGAQPKMSYAASGSYVALSTDVPILEEFLRNTDGQQKSLRDVPGISEATAKVGGAAGGIFGYENQSATTRSVIEMLKASAAETGETMLAPGIPAFNPASMFKDWFDFSLLPPFETIAKYFYMSVYSGGANADGLAVKMFTPVPPELRK